MSQLQQLAVVGHFHAKPFEFAALDFTDPRKNQYAYMLEGFDHDWIHCGTRAFGGYTNIDPGTYVLRIKGSNNDGIWNDEGAAVRIVIAPPWWRTPWAYGLYVVIVVAGGLGARWVAQNWNLILASRKARYVAHYRLHELIGEGGMGKVYRASDLRTKETVALKLLAPELLQDRRVLSRVDEHDDARETAKLVEASGRKAVLVPGDIKDPAHCRAIVEKAVAAFGSAVTPQDAQLVAAIERALAARGISTFAIDGVTGRIHLATDQQFMREPVYAQFADGKLAVIGQPR